MSLPITSVYVQITALFETHPPLLFKAFILLSASKTAALGRGLFLSEDFLDIQPHWSELGVPSLASTTPDASFVALIILAE